MSPVDANGYPILPGDTVVLATCTDKFGLHAGSRACVCDVMPGDDLIRVCEYDNFVASEFFRVVEHAPNVRDHMVEYDSWTATYFQAMDFLKEHGAKGAVLPFDTDKVLVCKSVEDWDDMPDSLYFTIKRTSSNSFGNEAYRITTFVTREDYDAMAR